MLSASPEGSTGRVSCYPRGFKSCSLTFAVPLTPICGDDGVAVRTLNRDLGVSHSGLRLNAPGR